MKYIITILFYLCSKSSEAQVIDTSWYTIDSTYTHTDSVNIQLMETIYANRDCYIGYPMNKLYANLPQPIGFSQPDNIGNRRGFGTAYYQYFTLYLPGEDGDGLYGFRITIASKVYVKVKDYIDKEPLTGRDNYVKELLKDAIIISIVDDYLSTELHLFSLSDAHQSDTKSHLQLL